MERWRSDCGCSAQSRPGWTQGWRKPLREALDDLRDNLSGLYAKGAHEFFDDPDGLRNRYISLLLRRSEEGIGDFLTKESGRTLAPEELVRAVSLLEMERNLLLMYTSCGWFFDELSGIETLQVMAYAARAAELGEKLFPNENFASSFRDKLAQAPSNIAEFRDGLRIFGIFIDPLRADLLRAGAHFAVSLLFTQKAVAPSQRGENSFYSYKITDWSLEKKRNGNNSYVLGYFKIMSKITLEEEALFSAALYRGGRDALCGVTRKCNPGDGNGLLGRMELALKREDEQELVGFFGHNIYSFRHLFKDEQRRIMNLVIEEDVASVTDMLRQTVTDYSGVMAFLASLSMPAPDAFRSAAEVVLNDDLLQALKGTPLDMVFLERRVEDAAAWHIPLDMPSLRHGVRLRFSEFLSALEGDVNSREVLSEFHALLAFVLRKKWDINLWEVQNRFASLMNGGPLPQDERGKLFALVGNLLKIRDRSHGADWRDLDR